MAIGAITILLLPFVFQRYADGRYQAVHWYIADYDEKLVKMSKVNEVLQHITTDLNYVSQDELDTNENLIIFKNDLLHVTDKEINLIPHTEILSNHFKRKTPENGVFPRFVSIFIVWRTAVRDVRL